MMMPRQVLARLRREGHAVRLDAEGALRIKPRPSGGADRAVRINRDSLKALLRAEEILAELRARGFDATASAADPCPVIHPHIPDDLRAALVMHGWDLSVVLAAEQKRQRQPMQGATAAAA